MDVAFVSITKVQKIQRGNKGVGTQNKFKLVSLIFLKMDLIIRTIRSQK